MYALYNYNWGERERAPPLMMSTALASVRPRTSRRLRMRDIHVIYAESNSADFAGFKNRLLLKWSQCKHSKKGTVRRDWNDVDNRNGRDVLEKRQRRETEGAVFETRGTGKEDGLDVLLRHRKKEMEDWKEISSEVGSGAYCFK